MPADALDQVRIDPPAWRIEGDPDAAARWTFRELDVGDRFRAALAVKEPINSLNGWYDTFYR